MSTRLLEEVGERLAGANSVLFVTGAGLSAEAGLHVFRGIAGLPREDDRQLAAALSADLFANKPAIAWRYFLAMDAAIRAAQPTGAHRAIAAFERELPRVVTMTINIDRLHQRAGAKSVIEMHGALNDLACARCEISTRCDDLRVLPEVPPCCASCGGPLRPDMPLFGEALPQDPMTRLQLEIEQGFDLVIAAGVDVMAPYLARPLLLARSEGVPTVEIGNVATDVSEVVDLRLRGSPEKVFELLRMSLSDKYI